MSTSGELKEAKSFVYDLFGEGCKAGETLGADPYTGKPIMLTALNKYTKRLLALLQSERQKAARELLEIIGPDEPLKPWLEKEDPAAIRNIFRATLRESLQAEGEESDGS